MLAAMRYGVPVATLAFLFGLLSWLLLDHDVVLGWFFLWPTLSIALVATGYLGFGAAILGKQGNGTRKPWGFVVAGPFLVFMWSVRRVLLQLRRDEAPWDLVAPGIYVGRMMNAAALPTDTGTVVDLTSEFSAPRSVTDGSFHYVLFADPRRLSAAPCTA